MTVDEGYIKYRCDWTSAAAIDARLARRLDRWRRPLFAAGLIGHDPHLDVGFGNLSIRVDDRRFVISGTQTGGLAETTGEHYSLVTDYDLAANRVACVGPLRASSEALTHAAVYGLDGAVGAVVHVHNAELWKNLLQRVPTTAESAAYGTPEIAFELQRLYRKTDLAYSGIAAMAGHENGVLSLAPTLEAAATRLLRLVGN